MSRPLDDPAFRADVYDWAGRFVEHLVLHEFPLESSILDVGAGGGKYRYLLWQYEAMDACEVWPPTVHRYALLDLYRHVFNVDVRAFVAGPHFDAGSYDLVIFGDVLEHLPRDDAQDVLDQVCELSREVIVVVPYRYEQGPENGNVYQRHLQSDLTPELMAEEYPMLRLVALETRDREPFKGIYRRRRSDA